MRNPLLKRLPRELVHDMGKYIVIFLFMTATIGFVSGFLVADHSMKVAFDERFEDCSIEDGHFTLEDPMTADLPEKIESEDVALYENFYKEANDGNLTYRVYINREDINLACLMEGKFAEEDNEIAVDRLFAENNGIEIGDTAELGGVKFEICGTVALSDYSSLFEKNTDLMFNAQDFTVALVTEDGFDRISDNHIFYCYSWIFDDASLSDKEMNDKSDDLKKLIASNAVMTEFVKEPDNQAIHFAGDDMGSDESMMKLLLYIVIAIMAFVFAVTTSNTIEQEAAVIGTLRASGYTKGELLRHYLTLPVIVTLIGAGIGNILGYTLFKNIVANMYYGSYSLPTYETLWSPYAFVLTTVVPCVIMLVVNFFIITNKLSLSPLKFLRRDLKKKRSKKAVKLPNFKFMHRFRLRILLQNISGYAVMFIGILFANLILLFGMMMTPLLTHYQTEVIDSMIADHQYILKMPVETEIDSAEKYAVKSLNTVFEDKSVDEVTVYGIEDDSLYLSLMDFKDSDRVYVSEGILEKYGLKLGDTITLETKYGEDSYDFVIDEAYNYPASLAIFIGIDNFREMFELEDDYFTGYFSNVELDDIDESLIASEVTQSDMTIFSDQLMDSMGSMFPMIEGFAVVLYMLLVYLLSKIIIEKNAASVSIVKILGYRNGEISRLYQISTAIVVVLSVLISLPIDYCAIKVLYSYIISSFSGWLTMYIDPMIWIKMFVIGVVSYGLVGLLQFRRIKKIPMEEALKNAE